MQEGRALRRLLATLDISSSAKILPTHTEEHDARPEAGLSHSYMANDRRWNQLNGVIVMLGGRGGR